MIQFNNYVKIIAILYLMVAIGLYYIKPEIMFKDGKIKQFGVGKNKTIFYYPMILIIISIILYISVYSIYLSQ